MSAKITAWVWELSFEVPSHKLVMLALADNTNADGFCFPFIKRISTYTGFTERNVQLIIKDLEKKGYLSREERFKKNKQQSSNCYQLHFEKDFPKIENLSTWVKPSSPMGEAQFTPTGEAQFIPPPPSKKAEKVNKNKELTETQNEVAGGHEFEDRDRSDAQLCMNPKGGKPRWLGRIRLLEQTNQQGQAGGRFERSWDS